MTETAVSFLLENMLKLINSANKLILKAYEERVIEKEQIEYLYEEMQFLQKFLKDSEEEPDEYEEKKSIVAKIRDVSYRAEDIMDWFVLNAVLQRDGSITDDFPLCFSSFKSIIRLAQKIWDCFTLSKTEILSVKQCKREMMESLSTLESYMAYKIHLHLHGVVVEEIKSIIIEVREIHQNGVTNLQLINRLHHKENDIRSLYKEVLSKAELFSWAEIIRNCFDRAREDFNPIETEVMDCWQELRGARFFLSRDYYPLFGMLEEMVGEAKKICDALANLTEEVKLIKAKVIKIYEKGLSVTWHNSFMSTHNFCLLLSLSGKIVDLAEKNFHSFEGVIEETKPITEINQKGWRLSWIESLVAVQIRQEFDTVTKEVKSIKREVMQIYKKKKKKMYGIGVPQVTKSSHGDSSKTASSMVKEEIIVGLDDETRMIIELLVGEHEKQLKVIPIIGMPGLGKTTLAMKVYNDPFIEYHFHIRAWTCVSQVYRSRDLLLNILTSADIHLKGNIDGKSDEDLGEVLYKSLKGKIYLIVLDDIWEFKAWNDLKRYFPNDNNGSRIIFTSRHVVVAVALHVEPHYLRFLNPDESWDLLRQKTFPGGSYPQELEEIGKKIAKKCRGLPLAILVVAGLLANTGETPYWWRPVAETVSSYITSNTDTEQYMDTLALSYNHLPHHLKSCFLYFGTFPEDSEIPVWKLILLWVAEGFIPRNQQRSLEEVAMDYMMDLIDRSLVIVSKKKSNGEIKACRVHDLLRDLCLRKAQEENFLCIIRGMNQNVLFNAIMPRRICINHEFELFNIVVDNGSSYLGHLPGIRSFYSTKKLSQFSVSSFCGNFKLLRVLNISFVEFSSFPEELQLLVHLRYLSFRVKEKCFQPSIPNLCKLETFIVGGSTGWLSFSYDIWKMVKLRHLYTKRSIEIPHVPNDDYPFVLEDLQTIGKLELYGHGEGVLRWIPNLKNTNMFFYGVIEWGQYFS